VAPWYLRYALLPGAGAALLAMLRLEGRTFHVAAAALLGRAMRPRRCLGDGGPRSARQWYPPDLLLLPDGSDARPRAMHFTGPGAVLIAVEHELGYERRGARHALVLRGWRGEARRSGARHERAPSGRVLVLAAGARVQVRAARYVEQ
jgi:hypothetical protein